MSERTQHEGKILSGIDGLGTATPEMVEKRARELAKMDGRDAPNETDRILARAEFQGVVDPQSPEAAPEVESVTEWDESPSASGIQAPKVTPEDEAGVPEILVEEGIEEADHESRLSAAESNALTEED